MNSLIGATRVFSKGKRISTRITSLELARGLSALIVMLGHLRAALFPDFQELSEASHWTGVFYLVSGMGHQAVIVFFVLSGYFVGGGVIRQGKDFEVLQYVVARLSRLWVVLIPALVLTFAADLVVLNWLPNVLDRAHIESWHSIPRDGVLQHGLSTALGNVIFLQTVAVPVFGSNGPLWSLAYEAWYYLLFPLMWLGFLSTLVLRRGILLLLSFFVFSAMTNEMRWLFLAWAMGALVQCVPVHYSVVGKRAFGFFAFVLMLVMLCLARLGRVPAWFPFAADLLPAAAVALWCLHVRFARDLFWPVALRRPVHGLSDVSFSLYLTHMPIIFVAVGALIPTGKLQPDAQGWCVYIALCVCILCGALLFWWTFERHAPAVREVVNSRVRNMRSCKTIF